MAKAPQIKRRYNLVVAEDLFRELENVAEKKGTTVVELIRKFIKLGLMVTDTEDSPDTAFLFQEGDNIQKVLIL